MSPAENALDQLRREIDQIDDALHDLLMRRTQVVEQVAQAKGRERPAMQPAREAVILRRLLARHAGPFPEAALVRIWREMISALTRLQGPFAIAVYAPEERRGLWDIARDHYGSATAMTAVNSPVAAVRAVMEGVATVAVVPAPEEGDPDPWWRFMMGSDDRTPRVVARLPFYGRGTGLWSEELDALALAPVPHEPTGDDHTLIGIELLQDISRGRIKDALEAVGLHPVGFRSWFGREGDNLTLHMVEIADFVGHHDKRLAQFAAGLGDAVARTTSLGGFAVPLSAGEPKKS